MPRRSTSLALLFLVAACACACFVVGQPTTGTPAPVDNAAVPQQQQPTPVVDRQQQPAAVPQQAQAAYQPPVDPHVVQTAQPVLAAAAPAQHAALENQLQQLTSAVGELKTAHASSHSQLAMLATNVADGLAKLSAADETQTTSGASFASRLDAVERQLNEIKDLVTSLTSTIAVNHKNAAAAASAKPTPDPMLAEIRAQQNVILERLANATSSWSFDHEALLEQAKTASYTYSTHASKFLQRWFAAAQQEYPHLLARAREYTTQGMHHARIYGEHGRVHANDAHEQLSKVLLTQGVPKAYVEYASLSMLGLVALVLVVSVWFLLSALCSALCCCCCARSKKLPKGEKKRLAKAAAAARREEQAQE